MGMESIMSMASQFAGPLASLGGTALGGPLGGAAAGTAANAVTAPLSGDDTQDESTINTPRAPATLPPQDGFMSKAAESLGSSIASLPGSLLSRYAHGKLDTHIQKSRQAALYPDSNSLDRLGAGGGGTSGVPPSERAQLDTQERIARLNANTSKENVKTQSETALKQTQMQTQDMASKIDKNITSAALDKATAEQARENAKLLSTTNKIRAAELVLANERAANKKDYVTSEMVKGPGQAAALAVAGTGRRVVETGEKALSLLGESWESYTKFMDGLEADMRKSVSAYLRSIARKEPVNGDPRRVSDR